MMSKLSVYSQLKDSPNSCLSALKAEIGLKTTCTPFAVKLIEALKGVKVSNEQWGIKVADTLLSSLQTLNAGGITAEDYDKIDFVQRGGLLTASARVEAFYRAAARKGYEITDTIIPVPQEDSDTTYFAENPNTSYISYILADQRKQPDRKYTAERVARGYFSKYIIRLNIYDLKRGRNLPQIVVEMSSDEMIAISNVSDQGIFIAKWETKQDGTGKKQRVIYDKINQYGFWFKWTKDMCEKSIVRKALKRVKEVLPDLKEAIYAFEQDEEQAPQEPQVEKPMINIPMQEVKVREDVNLKALTDEQKRDCQDLLEIYRANPKLMADKVQEIADIMESGERPIQDVINEYYADIKVFMRFKKPKEMVNKYFGGML